MRLSKDRCLCWYSARGLQTFRRSFTLNSGSSDGSIKNTYYVHQLYQHYHHHNFSTKTSSKSLLLFRPNTLFMNSKICTIQVFRNSAIYESTRNASTRSTAQPDSSSISTQAPAESTLEPADNEFAEQLKTGFDLNDGLESSVEALLHAPEKIGYLKSVGLDWGWGPTSVVEYVMEHLHVYMGTPWWATITITAILVRVILFRPYIASAENATRMAIVNPIAKPIIDKMMAAQRAGDQAGFFQYKQEQTLIYKRAGIKMWKSGIPFIQMVIGFGTFRLLNGMAKLPVPGLETGGTLWFPNLSVADPFYILPLATAATFHWVMKKGGETGVQTMNPKVFNLMKWGFPIISIVFTSWLPAGVQLTFFVSGLLSLAQASLLRQPWLRSYFQMTPLPETSRTQKSKISSTYKGNIRMAQNPVLSQAELSQRFQAPNSQKINSEPIDVNPKETTMNQQSNGSIKQILTGAVTDIKDTFKEVVVSGRNLAGDTKKEVQGRLDKAEMRQRELYEKKKQAEEWQARLEEHKLRRLERKKRKHQAQLRG